MTNLTIQFGLRLLSVALVTSCLPQTAADGVGGRSRSRISSITMPVPDKLKPLVAPEKINAYSLSIISGTCDSGITGTKIEKPSVKLELGGGTLANEKLKQGCAYTLIISLGKADSSGSKLEKIYLTNDTEARRTQIPIEKSRSAKIQATAMLYVTDDGKKDLGINELAILVPSVSESDVEIGVDIAQDGSNDYDWRKDAKFTDISQKSFSGKDYGSAYYRDVMTHTPASDRDFQSGPSTHAHETLHGLHAVMRNLTSQHDGFFYLDNGKGLYVDEPKENLKDVKNHIGQSFRSMASSRYDLYLVDQASSWPNTLYLFDEWNAYVATTRSAVEIKKAGQWDPSTNSDPIEGLVDFMYFCSASIISIKNIDAEYLVTNKQFKAAFAMIMEESVKWMNEAKKDPLWTNSGAWAKMNNFQTASDGAEVRQAVKDLMGDVWTKRVLGF